jgi:hypothetical protein
MKRQLLLLAAMLLFARSGFAQQTNGMLFCAFNGGVDIHATSEPWSPIIGRIRCGERVMVFEDRFALKHIRTEDGLEGFITDITIGQWAILWDSPQGPLLKSVPALPSGAAFPPTSASDFRRFEIAGLASYLRTNDTNFAGGEASFAAHLNDWFAIVAAADAHADVDLTDFRYTTYRAGVRWTPLRQTVTKRPQVDRMCGRRSAPVRTAFPLPLAAASISISVTGLRGVWRKSITC